MFYQIQEGHFTLEGEWRDRSVNMLAAQHLAVKGANLTITREPLPAGVEFDDYLSEQKVILIKELSGIRMHRDIADIQDGHPARYMEFSWDNQGNEMHQALLVVHHGGSVLNLTATMPGKLDESVREALLIAMKSFRFGPAPVEDEDKST
jgi:hypothetical protein